MTDTIETTAVAEPAQQALALVKPQNTAAQAKIDAVANLTMKAYERASTLALTPEEISALQADFPDDAFKPGAAGKENLIYIEHAYLRDRFNQVLGVGQWTLVPRSRWGEDYRTANGKEAVRVYVEGMLLVRGCFVAEKIGDMSYFKTNDSQNYGDAVEGAQTACLRRCAKELGVGLQAWKKDFCTGWWQRRNDFERRPGATGNSTPQKPQRPNPATAVVTTAETEKGDSRERPAPISSKFATEETRKWMMGKLVSCAVEANDYFRKAGMLLDTEDMQDLPLRFVPVNKDQLQSLMNAIGRFASGDPAGQAFPPNVERETAKTPVKPVAEAELIEEWRQFPMPWGTNADMPLEELDKKYLYGLWANYTVETEYNGKPKRPEQIAKDTKFREMLDAAGESLGFKKKD